MEKKKATKKGIEKQIVTEFMNKISKPKTK